MEHILNELKPQHPLSYDAFNLCECAKENKLSLFNVAMLKEIFSFFEVPFKSRDRKKEARENIKMSQGELKVIKKKVNNWSTVKIQLARLTIV